MFDQNVLDKLEEEIGNASCHIDNLKNPSFSEDEKKEQYDFLALTVDQINRLMDKLNN